MHVQPRDVGEVGVDGKPAGEALAAGGVPTLDEGADLGWDNSVSTTTWFSGIGGYYDELAASLGR